MVKIDLCKGPRKRQVQKGSKMAKNHDFLCQNIYAGLNFNQSAIFV